MNRTRPFLRAFTLAFATIQLAAGATAPVLEAIASAEDNAPYVEGSILRALGKHSHDANTCPICRLLDSPARPESKGELAYVGRHHEPRSLLVPKAVERLTDLGFRSRAPPAPLC